MNSPRIATITAFPLAIPFDHWASPPMFAGRPRTTLDTVLVRVTTDQGTVGWGEAYGSFWSAVVPAIAPVAGSIANPGGRPSAANVIGGVPAATTVKL